MLAIDAKTGKEVWRFYTVPPGNQDAVKNLWQADEARGGRGRVLDILFP